MRSGLPIYWLPCFGPDGRASLWQFRHDEVLETAPPAVQNFFLYALGKVSPEKLGPIAALARGLDPSIKDAVWKHDRRMWCTAGFLHAAGRAPQGRSGADGPVFWFQRQRVRLADDGTTQLDEANGNIAVLALRTRPRPQYEQTMRAALRRLLSRLGA